MNNFQDKDVGGSCLCNSSIKKGTQLLGIKGLSVKVFSDVFRYYRSKDSSRLF